jgi:hypothetical protein
VDARDRSGELGIGDLIGRRWASSARRRAEAGDAEQPAHGPHVVVDLLRTENRWITTGSTAPPGRRKPRLSGFPLVLEHAHRRRAREATRGTPRSRATTFSLAPGSRASGTASTLNSRGYGGSGLPSQRGLLPGAGRPQLPGVHRTGSRPGQASDHARERARRTGTQPRWAGRRSPSASARRRRTGEHPHGSHQPSTPYGTRRRAYTPMA